MRKGSQNSFRSFSIAKNGISQETEITEAKTDKKNLFVQRFFKGKGGSERAKRKTVKPSEMKITWNTKINKILF